MTTHVYRGRPAPGANAVLERYADVRAALGDDRFAHWWDRSRPSPGFRGSVERWFLVMEPASGSELRRAISARLSRPVSEARRDPIARFACGLTAGFGDDATVDVAAHYAGPIVADAIREIIGVPESRSAAYRAVFAPAVAELTTMMASNRPDRSEPYRAWAALVDGVSAADPGGDHVIGDIERARLAGDDVREGDLPAFALAFAFAAYENVVNLIATVLHHVAVTPSARSAALDERACAAMIEELCRLASPLRAVKLVARETIDAEPAGFSAGDVVVARIDSANRDPEQFTAAASETDATCPHGHLAFGAGKFACIGASLARIISLVAVTEFVQAFETISFSGRLAWKDSAIFAGPQSVPLTVRRASVSA